MVELMPGAGLKIPVKQLTTFRASRNHQILVRNLFRHFFTREQLLTHTLSGKALGAASKNSVLPELDPNIKNVIFGKTYSIFITDIVLFNTSINFFYLFIPDFVLKEANLSQEDLKKDPSKATYRAHTYNTLKTSVGNFLGDLRKEERKLQRRAQEAEQRKLQRDQEMDKDERKKKSKK